MLHLSFHPHPYYYVAILIGWLTTLGCSQQAEKPYDLGTVSLEKSITSISDTIFFSQISDIEFYENHFYTVDQKTGTVLKTSHDFTEAEILITRGPGPEELRNAYNVKVFDDQIYCLDLNRKVKVFDLSGNYLRSLPIDAKSLSDFDVTVNELVITNFADQQPPILNFSLKDSVTTAFGSNYQERSRVKTHIIQYDVYTLEVFSENRPLIKVYGNTKDLTSTLDLTNLDIYQFSREDIDANRGKTVIWDASMRDNLLYLLLATSNRQKKPEWNKVLSCLITKDGLLAPQQLFELKPDGQYITINAPKGKSEIVLFDVAGNSIDSYSLN